MNDHHDQHSHHGHSQHNDHFEHSNHPSLNQHQSQHSKIHDEKAHNPHAGHTIDGFNQRFWLSLALTIPILLLSPMIHHWTGFGLSFAGYQYLLWLLSSIVFFYGGFPFFAGMKSEVVRRKPGMMTLIAVAIITAYLYSSLVVLGLSGMDMFWELATLIDIMLLGHWLEMKSIMGASRALEALARLMPSEAHKVVADNAVVETPIHMLVPGDKVLVKPGEKIPADGIVIDGVSSVNEAMLTGESQPVSKQASAAVIGGSINGEGSLIVAVQKAGRESFLAQVMSLVQAAQQSKSATQNLADRAAFWLTVIALVSGGITLVTWLSIKEQSIAFALERAVTVMVTACPHALGLAIPLVVSVSTSLAAQSGLLIKNRTAFENARKVQAVVFDKTGTLTLGKFGVTNVLSFTSELTEKEIVLLAASLEAQSEHPIAKGIAAATNERLPVDQFHSITGKGVEGMIGGKRVKVVSPGYLRENQMDVTDGRMNELLNKGQTVVYVLVNDRVAGAIAVEDIVRPEAKTAVAALKAMGIQCMMLTGDNRHVAARVAAEVGLDEYFAEVLPDEKAEKIVQIQSRGYIVAMTGDGVNDAPALARADVGIAIGAGADVAVETADIVLIRSNPLDIVATISLARDTYRKMIQNLVWATGYNIVAIPLAAGVLYQSGIVLSPAVGAILMSVSTVIVAVNAKLLTISR
jgi:Cu2+-exporting ATPase